MKDKKLQESINYVCFCCPYIDTETDVSDKYCDRCMVRKMVDYYDALEKHPFDVDMPEVQAIINYQEYNIVKKVYTFFMLSMEVYYESFPSRL